MRFINFCKPAFAIAALAALSGCATTPQPFSVPDGRYFGRVALNRYPVFITKIDGETNIQTAPLITPGEHRISVVSFGPHLGPVPREETLALNMKPCTRYILAAQHPNAVSDRFTPMVDETLPEAGCKP